MKSKYGNKKSGGFDSKKEKRYYEEILKSIDAGLESSPVCVNRQVRFQLLPSQKGLDGKVIERPVSYIADFVVTYKDGSNEVIDVKGFKTADYVIKRKLMLFIHGIKIKEV